MAVYSWFRNVKAPSPETGDYIHVHFLPIQRGWVWQIPIYRDATSVGVVVEKSVFQRSGKDYETFFHDVTQMSTLSRTEPPPSVNFDNWLAKVFSPCIA